MAAKALPPQELLLQLLRYEPDTGKLFWRERTPTLFRKGRYSADVTCAAWNTAFAGKEAFTSLDQDGYKAGAIFGRRLLAHRVIWKMVTGYDPNLIDHIDGVCGNNRFSNLRSVTLQENLKNQATPISNKSGVMGVHWCKRERKWCARVKVGLCRKLVGYFDDFDLAVAAIKTAQVENGFHPNHGRKRRSA